MTRKLWRLKESEPQWHFDVYFWYVIDVYLFKVHYESIIYFIINLL